MQSTEKWSGLLLPARAELDGGSTAETADATARVEPGRLGS
jgi:hypothetical protein